MILPIPETHPYPKKARFDFTFPDVASAFHERQACASRGMFAFVSWDWVKPLVAWIGNRKVLEVMAGAGWLARALSEKGINIIATDDYSWIEKREWELQTEVKKMDAFSAIEIFGEESDILIISWPYMDPSAFEAIRKWNEIRPGGLIIYIGEQEGGCTANEEFFEHFEEVNDDTFNFVIYNYRTWEGLHDTIMLGKYKL